MTKLVVLNLGKGDFRQGFSTVTVQLWENSDRIPVQLLASLPPTSEIPELYRRWQLLYCLLNEAIIRGNSVTFDEESEVEIEEEDITNISLMEFDDLCDELKKQINLWLKSPSFIHIEQKLRTKLALSDEIRFIIETENEQVRQIPWHLWDLFEDYQYAVACLGSSEFENPKTTTKNPNRSMRILAILGNSDGIDIQKDRKILETISGAKTLFLVEPTRRELDNCLWDKQGWDIIFFAGHSYSQYNGESGKIYINKTDSLKISQLKNGLKSAVSHGLGLVIFNSCDGLGLAQDLASLHIPQIIVMREPVTDAVAQTFLKYFIQAFATGESLYLSVREAQARLQGLEDEFPCASWLPVICQNPAAQPLVWRKKSKNTVAVVKRSFIPSKKAFVLGVQTSISITALVMGVRSLGWMQSWELSAFDSIMRSRPAETPDNRIILVTVTEADVQAQPAAERGGASLSDKTLAQIIEKIEPLNPRVVGLDIYHENPVSPEYQKLKAFMQTSDRFVVICKAGEDETEPGVPPPPGVPPQSLGFSDVVPDADTIVRRQLLAMAPPTDPAIACKTDKSFNYRIATSYLKSQNITAKLTPDDNWLIGTKVFQSVQANSGGYHQIDSRGYQVFLNWRAANPFIKRVTVREVLNNQLTADLVKNRIVLIGTIAESFNDERWSTPYTTASLPYKQVAGVVVQAHMISQILSATLDNRPLLWVLPKWAEFIWVGCWSVIGCLIAYYSQSKWHLVISLIIGSGALYITCLFLLVQGVWIPSVPSAIVLLGSAAMLIIYTEYQTVNKNWDIYEQS
ncbi:CHASE2 domain-containing protein [Calothrix sp. PCC 6303]|uniref:CHASE2 domain-containing protein n=1 Tax=Calothrix sp. PCC 6303 TaxID=1170562 RepID=UPI0002A050D8|nr:CHASE2 domain-containing protein [Calothrix sp. PCC 6303]AFZ02872.1 putative Chase2 sensor protein [Calothrix sp. PCC 6303]